jgi:hypothetical protein
MSQECDDEFQGLFYEIWSRPINRRIREQQAEALMREGLDDKAILAVGRSDGVSRAAQAEIRERLKGRYSEEEIDEAAERAQIPNVNDIPVRE